MATFTNVFHVGEVLAYLLRLRLNLLEDQVIVGPPRVEILNTKKHLRLTLLWTNELPTHRNNLPERNPDGTRARPPLSLSAAYLITTYGNTSSEASADAHEALGDLMRVFHDEPELTLPLQGLAGKGKGKLGITLAPMTPELGEKLFGPLQIKHRTFALYEVGPVQLESLQAMLAARPVVRPDGIRLMGPSPKDKPVLEEVVPSIQGAGGRIRLDGTFPEPLTRVRVGEVSIEKNAINILDSGRSVSVLLPATLKEDTYEVSVTAGAASSDPVTVQVIPATATTLDSPLKITQSKSANLVLSGRGLSGVAELIAWPDAGVQSPNDLVKLPVTALANQITVAAAALKALSTRTYRFAARFGAGQYTPHIVLQVIP